MSISISPASRSMTNRRDVSGPIDGDMAGNGSSAVILQSSAKNAHTAPASPPRQAASKGQVARTDDRVGSLDEGRGLLRGSLLAEVRRILAVVGPIPQIMPGCWIGARKVTCAGSSNRSVGQGASASASRSAEMPCRITLSASGCACPITAATSATPRVGSTRTARVAVGQVSSRMVDSCMVLLVA